MAKRTRAPSTSVAPTYLELNVGNYIFGVCRSELTAHAGRLRDFATDKTSADDVDSEGRPFFARDGVAFEAVIAFLRTGYAIVPRESTAARVQAELEYFFALEPPRAITETAHAHLRAPALCELMAIFVHMAHLFCNYMTRSADAFSSSGIIRSKYAAMPVAAKLNIISADVDDEQMPLSIAFTLHVPPYLCQVGRLASGSGSSTRHDVVHLLLSHTIAEHRAIAEALAMRLAAEYASIVRGDDPSTSLCVRVTFGPSSTIFKAMCEAYAKRCQPPPLPPAEEAVNNEDAP
jgi:hypothetical protein